MNPSLHAEKTREEAKRDRMFDPVLRWKQIQEMITWAEANMPEHQRRNRPRGPRARLCLWPIFLVFALLVSSTTLSRAEDWQTTDGKVYHDVKVMRLDPDAVTILHRDGGALVPLATLPPDLQKRFYYDPDKAKIAADARAQQESDDAKALLVEAQAATQERVEEAAQEERAAEPNSDAAHPASSLFSAALSTNSTHHSMDELVSSAQAMRPDLTDPTYHTMAHLVWTVHTSGLGHDPNDPNHHTISDATNRGQ